MIEQQFFFSWRSYFRYFLMFKNEDFPHLITFQNPWKNLKRSKSENTLIEKIHKNVLYRNIKLFRCVVSCNFGLSLNILLMYKLFLFALFRGTTDKNFAGYRIFFFNRISGNPATACYLFFLLILILLDKSSYYYFIVDFILKFSH